MTWEYVTKDGDYMTMMEYLEYFLIMFKSIEFELFDIAELDFFNPDADNRNIGKSRLQIIESGHYFRSCFFPNPGCSVSMD